MNLKFWKHKKRNEVVKQECFDKVPSQHQTAYFPTDEEPTHEVSSFSNDNYFLLPLITSEIISDSFDTGSSSDLGSSSSDFDGFGGGDFGGGGSSEDW